LDPEFLRGLEKLTRQREELLIFDEVVTGFRYSPGGAQGLYGLNPDLSCFAKVVAGGMPGGAVVGRADVMKLFDVTGDPQHDRFGRVVHQGTFNGAPLCAAAGVAVLKQVATGEPIARANALAAKLRAAWDQVLGEMGVAGYLYGVCSTFHVYFETDRDRVQAATSRAELYTNDADRLKGMPGALVESYQRQLRFHGVDNMSSTGGLLSAAHTDRDIEEATVAFRQTVEGLLASGQVLSL
jgi:glutamate-1-semialdehyde 2,1-aminomutase